MAESAVTQDPDAAREFREAYGFSGNAEQIIRANQMRQTPELRRAERLSLDTEATTELEKSDVASQADVDEGQVRGFAVRGDFLVVVYENDMGSLTKTAIPREGAEVTLSADELTQKANADQEARMLAAAREARAAEAEAIEEARQKAQEESQERMAQAAEESAEQAAKDAEAAQKAEEEGATPSSGATGAGEQAHIEAAEGVPPKRSRRSASSE